MSLAAGGGFGGERSLLVWDSNLRILKQETSQGTRAWARARAEQQGSQTAAAAAATAVPTACYRLRRLRLPGRTTAAGARVFSISQDLLSQNVPYFLL